MIDLGVTILNKVVKKTSYILFYLYFNKNLTI